MFFLSLNTPSKGNNNEKKCVEGDNPRDLFMCGTDVTGSCQSVYGSTSLNKCLMGYVANGQNRLIAIKGDNEKIRARSIIRILIDQSDQPVLFLERIYPANASKQERKAILRMAIKKAQKLGLNLYTKEVKVKNYKIKTNTMLKSLGGQAPFEYYDAIHGIAGKGKLIIKESLKKIIY